METRPHPEPASAGRRWWRPERPAGPVTDLGRLLIGAVVVALGTLFLLDSADVLDADRAIGRWWPVVIVAAGVLTLLERPPALVRGLLVTAVGAVLLLFTTDVLDESAWNYVWPVAVIAAGVVILLRWSGHGIPAGAARDEVVRSTAVFSGAKVVCSGRFEGAFLTAVFGGVTLDLRDARPAAGAAVNATVAFGGIDVLVPHGWRITVRSTPIFGGVEDATEHAATPLPDDAPALDVDAVCLFGGVGIKHAP